MILDGVFGFSISRPIEEPIASLLRAAKSSGKKVVAIDVPSGANPDSGTFDPNGLPADVCLPVGLHKLGPAVRFGDPCYGDRIEVLDVDMPTHLSGHIRREVNDLDLARTLIPDRSATGHKGDFGRALLYAGSSSYVGAAELAAQACARSGVGLVAVATPNSVFEAIAGNVPEATYIPLDEDVNGVLARPGLQRSQRSHPGRGLRLDRCWHKPVLRGPRASGAARFRPRIMARLHRSVGRRWIDIGILNRSLVGSFRWRPDHHATPGRNVPTFGDIDRRGAS